MAPTLRGQRFHTPSPEPLANREATTTRKCRFFDALSRDGGSKSLRSISKACGIGETTGRDWKKQFENIGSLAKRKTRKRSTKLGRRSKVTKLICKMLVSPSRNPVRKQLLDIQIVFHDIPVKTRQIQRKLKEHIKGGGRYLCAFIKKEISEKNHRERAQYGDCYIYDPLFGFFDHIVYTDEAHIDPTSQAQGRVLREQGTRDRLENIEERPPLKGWGKAPKLEFYNNEEDKVERPPMPPKPRRRPTTETEEEWHCRLAEWEALKPHDVEVTVKGNAMTQKYYVERLLLTYVAAIKNGDPSHGMYKAGLARKYKDAHDVQNLVHPAQSPDLNPIEGIWAIIKQRLCRRIFDSEEEMKEAL
ncbi:hypothetical protein LSUE1_G007656 [Lachnellula suecica]|uniref:Tc1-like transposase DDE domain-containing protein n=1 Tax=Lachnellula suecica TaxID=602035 RepID=A0A8T9CCE5_9HELO|nr:hypothetical protein LSUE1_G007656 [Lachnellula suecica]